MEPRRPVEVHEVGRPREKVPLPEGGGRKEKARVVAEAVVAAIWAKQVSDHRIVRPHPERVGPQRRLIERPQAPRKKQGGESPRRDLDPFAAADLVPYDHVADADIGGDRGRAKHVAVESGDVGHLDESARHEIRGLPIGVIHANSDRGHGIGVGQHHR